MMNMITHANPVHHVNPVKTTVSRKKSDGRIAVALNF